MTAREKVNKALAAIDEEITATSPEHWAGAQQRRFRSAKPFSPNACIVAKRLGARTRLHVAVCLGEKRVYYSSAPITVLLPKETPWVDLPANVVRAAELFDVPRKG